MIAFNFEYHLLYANLMYLILNEYYKQHNIHLGFLGIVGYLLTFSLPDIDITSKASKKIPVIPCIIQLFTKHRGFTHSIFALFIIYNIFNLTGFHNLAIGAGIGYASHLITDMSTNNGITLFWPLPIRIKIPIIRHFKKITQILWILILTYILAEYDEIIVLIQNLHFK